MVLVQRGRWWGGRRWLRAPTTPVGQSGTLDRKEFPVTPIWTLPACELFLSQGLPFHLVQLECGAGINLVGDFLPRWPLISESGQKLSGPDQYPTIPYPILSRTGLDHEPKDASDPFVLGSLVQDSEHKEKLKTAIQIFLTLKHEDFGPKLFPWDPAKAGPDIAARVPHQEGQGLLLFNTEWTCRLSNGEYERLRGQLRTVLKPWGERGLWLELEVPREGETNHYELRAHRVMAGGIKSAVLARIGLRDPGLVVFKKGWEVVTPKGVTSFIAPKI